nr:hypothetical protein [Tanacetum cinerariifolium]
MAMLQTLDLTIHDFDRDMKSTMNSAQLLWEFKSIGNGSNFGNDLKRSNITRVQLSLFSKTYHPFLWRYFQHDLILHLKLKGFLSYVGIALLMITNSLDTALDLNNLLSCLVDDLWASELAISNFSPTDRDLQKCEANLPSRSEMNKTGTSCLETTSFSIVSSTPLMSRLLSWEMQDNLEELPIVRFEAMEPDIEGLHSSIKATQQDRRPPTRQGFNSATIKQLIAQCVADAMTVYEANCNSINGANNEMSGSVRGVEHAVRSRSYKEFLTCKPHNF